MVYIVCKGKKNNTIIFENYNLTPLDMFNKLIIPSLHVYCIKPERRITTFSGQNIGRITITRLNKQKNQHKNVNIFLPIIFSICLGCLI